MWGVQLQEFLWRTSEYVWKCIVILICIWEGLGQSVLQERETNDIHCIHSDQGCSHIPDPTLRSIHSWGISSSLSSSTCCPYSMLQRICVFFLCFIITIVVHLYDPKNCSLLMFSSGQKLLWVGIFLVFFLWFCAGVCFNIFCHLCSLLPSRVLCHQGCVDLWFCTQQIAV